jgi:ABC-2 type transport system ATP-binding protein
MITTESLTKKFGAITAVDHLDLEVAEGEVFGFLGPNGAGKTTTVRMLSCLIGPTSGSAVVNGHRLGVNDKEIRRSVGLLTETPGMYDSLSAEYNLDIYAHLYEVADVKGQVEKYLRMLGLWDRRHDEAGTFSKGMKQKLAICRALLHEPRLLFLDEPTAGLDPESARLVRDFITELRQEGRTIFLCTHNLDEADRLCDRIGVFKSRLLVVDSPANLRRQLFGRKVVFHLVPETLPGAAGTRPTLRQEARLVDSNWSSPSMNPKRITPISSACWLEREPDIQFVGELRTSLEDIYLHLIKNEKSEG